LLFKIGDDAEYVSGWVQSSSVLIVYRSDCIRQWLSIVTQLMWPHEVGGVSDIVAYSVRVYGRIRPLVGVYYSVADCVVVQCSGSTKMQLVRKYTVSKKTANFLVVTSSNFCQLW